MKPKIEEDETFDEYFDDFYAKLSVIVKLEIYLIERIDEPKIMRKSSSLPIRFHPKVIAIV